MAVLIKNGICVTPKGEEKLDVLLEDGRITQLQENIMLDDCEVYDAQGCLIFPGFIDAHTHLDMNNGVMNTADDFASGTAGAISGGTTTLIDFATQDKGHSLNEALKLWHSKADGKSSCNYAFHMAITDWNDSTEAELADMSAAGITSFKLYMAYDALRVTDAQIFEVLTAVNKLHGIVGVHCENGDLVNELIKSEKSRGHYSTRFHPVTRPDYVEAEAIARFCAIGRAAGTPVHIVHLSTKLGLEEIRRARARGQKIYVESCPQYFTLDESKYLMPGVEGTKYVCSPPLRSRIDVDALWQALKQGEINTISTDHCSFNLSGQKDVGKYDFAIIPNGMPGIEHRAEIMLSLGLHKYGFTANEMANLLSTNAARLFGLENKGEIRLGADADIVVWDKNAEHTITAEKMHQNVDYTPYEGVQVQGEAKAVFLAGELVCTQGNILAQNKGKYVERGQSEYF
ncbi:MAG: dihydropyrimidinase [Oscillospiraceae bacterium]